MPANVSHALNGDTSEIVTVKRTPTSGYVNGLFVKGEVTTFKAICSVQQPSPDDLLYLPEGERDKDLRKFVANKYIRTSRDKDGLIADSVYYKGNWYKVIFSADWDTYGHTTCIGARDINV